MLTMDDLRDSGHPFPTRHVLDYANGYQHGMEHGASPLNRATLRHMQRELGARVAHPSPTYRAGYVRARLDCTAAILPR